MKKKTKKIGAKMSPTSWRAAVDLLMAQVSESQTLLVQIVNDPSNPDICKMIIPVFEMNRIVMRGVKARVDSV